MGRKRKTRYEKPRKLEIDKDIYLPMEGKGIRKEKLVIIIVCEGKTEQNYFKELATIESGKGIVVKPELSDKPNWRTILEKTKEYKPDDNTKVYYALDLDCIINQSQMGKYVQEKKKLPKEVVSLESNTCFETWLLYHYKDSPRISEKCENHETDLNKYIPNYKKGKGKIYSITKDNLQTACVNAERSCKIRQNNIKDDVSQESNCRFCFSEVWRLIKDLGL